MKLKPRQIIGLIAVVLFGAILIQQFTQGRRDPDVLPSGARLSDLPSPSSLVQPPAPAAAAPAADPLTVGSPEARDDLYCAGAVFAEALGASGSEAEAKRLNDAYRALAEAGRRKLEAEGAAVGPAMMAAGNAWYEVAREDHRAGKLRISVADCLQRASGEPDTDP